MDALIESILAPVAANEAVLNANVEVEYLPPTEENGNTSGVWISCIALSNMEFMEGKQPFASVSLRFLNEPQRPLTMRDIVAHKVLPDVVVVVSDRKGLMHFHGVDPDDQRFHNPTETEEAG